MTSDNTKGEANRRRILALLQRNPGLTTGEMAASLSGMTRLDARRTVQVMRDMGLITRSAHAPVTWYAAVAAENVPAPRERTFIPYTQPTMEPARNDASLHELVGSRRGDEVVPHAKPVGMMTGKLGDTGNHSHTQLIKKPVSPLYGNTFCKLAPDAKPGRKKVAA
jgi:hypothetical protein